MKEIRCLYLRPDFFEEVERTKRVAIGAGPGELMIIRSEGAWPSSRIGASSPKTKTFFLREGASFKNGAPFLFLSYGRGLRPELPAIAQPVAYSSGSLEH